MPLYDHNVNSNTLAEGKNTLPKVCRSLWSLLCEIFLHYFVRLKLQNFGTDLFSLMKEKKKTISMPTDVLLCPPSFISCSVNTFTSNSIQVADICLFPAILITLKDTQPVSIRTRNKLLN